MRVRIIELAEEDEWNGLVELRGRVGNLVPWYWTPKDGEPEGYDFYPDDHSELERYDSYLKEFGHIVLIAPLKYEELENE